MHPGSLPFMPVPRHQQQPIQRRESNDVPERSHLSWAGSCSSQHASGLGCPEPAAAAVSAAESQRSTVRSRVGWSAAVVTAFAPTATGVDPLSSAPFRSAHVRPAPLLGLLPNQRPRLWPDWVAFRRSSRLLRWQIQDLELSVGAQLSSTSQGSLHAACQQRAGRGQEQVASWLKTQRRRRR